MKLPSKELLSEVFALKINLVETDEHRRKIYYYCNQFGKITGEINIYEFAHKCKEWAIKIDYKIESHIHFINKRIIGVASFNTQDNTNKFFQADTEPEAIFKACEWIVEQIKCGS